MSTWNDPQPQRIPRSTWWPACLALGVTLVFLGMLTSLVASAGGAVLGGCAIAGWIVEVRRETSGDDENHA